MENLKDLKIQAIVENVRTFCETYHPDKTTILYYKVYTLYLVCTYVIIIKIKIIKLSFVPVLRNQDILRISGMWVSLEMNCEKGGHYPSSQ